MSSIQAAFYEGNRSIRVGDCGRYRRVRPRCRFRSLTAVSAVPTCTFFTGRWITASIFRQS
jgi:hypothetical protein